MIHLYFNYEGYMPLDKDYRKNINVHISDKKPHRKEKISPYIPDLNIFDYAIGYEPIEFPRYYSLLENNERYTSLEDFFKKIIQSAEILSTKKREKGGRNIPYFDIQDNIYLNHSILECYHLKIGGLKLKLIILLTRLLVGFLRLKNNIRK